MRYRELGTTGISASVIGFGTFPLGGWLWGGVEEKNAVMVLQNAIDSGINLIDTAPMYGNGRAEEIVGKAIRGRRDRVVLATKCGVIWSREDWPAGKGDLFFYADENGASFEKGEYRLYRYLKPESIVKEVEESLKRLGTDHIDLLQTHQQDSTTPIEETMSALETLRKQGKIRAIGSSNVSRDQMRQYCDSGTLDCTQEHYSYLHRDVEQNGVLELCRDRRVSLLAYTPLEYGLLAGLIRPDTQFTPGDFRAHTPQFASDNVSKINDALGRLAPLRERYGLTTGQLMLAWAASRYERTHVLCGMRNPSRIEENVRAGETTLTVEDMQEMERLFDPKSVA